VRCLSLRACCAPPPLPHRDLRARQPGGPAGCWAAGRRRSRGPALAAPAQHGARCPYPRGLGPCVSSLMEPTACACRHPAGRLPSSTRRAAFTCLAAPRPVPWMRLWACCTSTPARSPSSTGKGWLTACAAAVCGLVGSTLHGRQLHACPPTIAEQGSQVPKPAGRRALPRQGGVAPFSFVTGGLCTRAGDSWPHGVPPQCVHTGTRDTYFRTAARLLTGGRKRCARLLPLHCRPPQVTDFNLSRILEDSSQRQSSAGVLNPRWLAPEVRAALRWAGRAGHHWLAFHQYRSRGEC